jgi:hypothetical protein
VSKKAFDKIAEGLEEALAIARGEAAPAKRRTRSRNPRKKGAGGRNFGERAKSRHASVTSS